MTDDIKYIIAHILAKANEITAKTNIKHDSIKFCVNEYTAKELSESSPYSHLAQDDTDKQVYFVGTLAGLDIYVNKDLNMYLGYFVTVEYEYANKTQVEIVINTKTED